MYDVIIIGAGFAGLRAARDLHEQGKSVVVLEARDRIGGRTRYDYLEGLDQKVEYGGTWVMPKFQPHVQAEVDRYELELGLSPAPENYRWRFNGATQEGGFPIPFEEIPALEHAMTEIINDARRIEFGKPFEEQGLEDLDIPFSDWLDQHGLKGTPREIVSSYGAALCFGVAPESVSALHVLSWVAGSANSPWELFNGPTIKFAHGTASLYDKLATDVEVRLSSPVVSVSQNDDAVTVTTQDGQLIQAYTAVVAAPLNTWKSIDFSPPLSQGKADFTREELAGRDVKLWVQLRGIADYSAGLGWNTPLQWLSCEFQREEGSVMCGFAYDETQLDTRERASIEKAVHDYFPEAEIVQWWSEDWNGSPWSLGTWTAYRPGQITRLAAESRRAESRLAFASADIAVGFSGWIEGALESGAAAAEHILGVL